MLFHADRNVKDNMFQYMKREAEDRLAKKNENKMLSRNEDRIRIESIMQTDRADQERRRMEKLKQANDMMNGYNDLMNQKTERGLRRNKFEDIKINTYGVNYNSNIGNTRANINQNNRQFEDYTNNNVSSGYPGESFQNLNEENELQNNNSNRLQSNHNTHLNPITQNSVSNYEQMIRDRKFEQQKSYKELLDSQVNQKDVYSMNKSHPHLNRRNPANNAVNINPYTKKQYDIGDYSLMQHNPIIHPVNNFGYNKYINFVNNPSTSFNTNPTYSNVNSSPNNMNNFNTDQNIQHNSMLYNTNRINNYNNLNQNNFPNNGFVDNNPNSSAGNNLNYNHMNYNADNTNYGYPHNIGVVNNTSQPIINNQSLNDNFNGRTPLGGDRLRMAANNIIG